MSATEIRRWMERWRAAEEREREQLRSSSAATAAAVSAALELIALHGKLHGWPAPDDPVTLREDEQARACWDLLRRRSDGSR